MSIGCDCCGSPAPAPQPALCAECLTAGCSAAPAAPKRMPLCPLILAGSDVVMCLHCERPLHRSEWLTFIDNAHPGLGGCHGRCVEAYHAARRAALDS